MKKRILITTILLVIIIAGFVAVHAATGTPVQDDDPIMQQLQRLGAADAVYCGIFEDPVSPGTYYKLYQSKDTGFEYRLSPDAGYIQNVWRMDPDSQGDSVSEETRQKNASDFFQLYMSDYQVGEFKIENAYDNGAFHTYYFIELLDGMETGTVGTVFCAPNGEVTSAVFVKGEILPTAGDAAPLSAQSFPETVSQEAAAQTALEAARQDAGKRHATVVSVPDTAEGQLKASGADRLWMFEFPVEVQDEGGAARPVGYRIWIDASTGEVYQLYRSMND